MPSDAITLDFSKAQPITLDFSKAQPLNPVPAPVISRNPRTGLPQTVNDVTGIPTAATAVGSLVGPEGAAVGAGAGTTVDEMLHGTPAGDAAWSGVKNALYTELGGRAMSLASKFGAPVLQKIADVLDEYELKLPKSPSVNPLSYIEKKPAEATVQSLTESPNYNSIVAARNLARKAAREALSPKPAATPAPSFTPLGGSSTARGSLSEMANGFTLPPVPVTPAQAPAAMVTAKAAAEEAPKSRTIFVPMKSSPGPESAKPGDLWTIPREKLIGLAKSGNADAATVLQRLGHKVIFVPNPAE